MSDFAVVDCCIYIQHGLIINDTGTLTKGRKRRTKNKERAEDLRHINPEKSIFPGFEMPTVAPKQFLKRRIPTYENESNQDQVNVKMILEGTIPITQEYITQEESTTNSLLKDEV